LNFFIDTKFYIIEPILGFRPIFNTQYSYFNDLLKLNLGILPHTILLIFAQITISVCYGYYRTIQRTETFLIDISYIFGQSALICDSFSKYCYLCPKDVRMKKVDFVYDIDEHEKYFFSLLPEHLRRKYAGLLAMKGGYYCVSNVSNKFGIHKNTVRAGKNELINKAVPPVGRIRQEGGGRKKKLQLLKI
jgi:hypothetical protein